jgi:hypothetical protein
MKQYTPRTGSVAHQIIEHLKVHGLTTPQGLAEALGLDKRNLRNNLGSAIQQGVIARDNAGSYYLPDVHTLTAEIDLDPEAETEPFTAGLFSDGELCLMNAGKAGDTELILTKEQTRTLVNYLFRFEYSDQAQELIPAGQRPTTSAD